MENSVYDIRAQEYNLKLAEALKKVPEFQEPEWAKFVKSGAGKERPIEDDDFWGVQNYTRSIIGPEGIQQTEGQERHKWGMSFILKH